MKRSGKKNRDRERERERKGRDGRGTKKLEGWRDWNRDRNRVKKNEEEGREGPCVLLKVSFVAVSNC